jgi:hypothetical protein
MKLDNSFRRTVYESCIAYYDCPSSEDTCFFVDSQDADIFDESFTALDVLNMVDVDYFDYEESDGEVEINGVYSYDLDLFYTVEEIRNLFKWDTAVKEFEEICALAAGDSDACLLEDYEDDSESFHTCVEEQLAEMLSFNYISECEEAREVLYNICLYNYSMDLVIDEAGNYVLVISSAFYDEFPSFDDFNSLFE